MLTGAFSPMHLVVVFVVALVVLGPEELPGAARKAARFVLDLRRWWADVQGDVVDLVGVDLTPRYDPTPPMLDPVPVPREVAAPRFPEPRSFS